MDRQQLTRRGMLGLMAAAAGAVALPGSAAAVTAASTARTASPATLPPGTIDVTAAPYNAVGDGVTDDTTAFVNALAAAATTTANSVYVPTGTYQISSVRLHSGLTLFGDAAPVTVPPSPSPSVLRSATSDTSSQYLLNTLTGETGDPSGVTSMSDITIHDLTLDGQCATWGYEAFYYLLNANSVSSLTVDNVYFLDFRGDGMYLGAGNTLPTAPTMHNDHVSVSGCTFNGVNGETTPQNRNGISVIDCTTLRITDCTFTDIGHVPDPTKGQIYSVGAIDFEPDTDYSVYTDIQISGCSFTAINQTNTAAITYHGRPGQPNNKFGSVTNCTFNENYTGISCATGANYANTDNLTVNGGIFTNSLRFDINVTGSSDVTIESCTFTTDASTQVSGTSYFGGIGLGSAADVRASDVTISHNTFTELSPQFGAITLYSASGVQVTSNTFNDVKGVIVEFMTDAVSGPFHIVDGLVLNTNTVNNQNRTTWPTVCYFDGVVTNSLVNATCSESGSTLNNSVPRYRPGNPASNNYAILPGGQATATPAYGTWAVGDAVTLIGTSTTVDCTVAGTIGTLTTTTVTATQGSTTAVVDSTITSTGGGALRPGHYVTIGGATYQLAAVVFGFLSGTLQVNSVTLTLATPYAGTSGSGIAVAWSQATFS